MVKRAGGALLLSIAIDHDSPRVRSARSSMSALRDLMLSGAIAAGDEASGQPDAGA